MYRFLEAITASTRLSEEPMVYYNVQALKQSVSSQVNKCCEQIEDLNSECVVLRQRFKESREQLRTAQIALCDVTKENEIFRKKCEVAKQTVR